jgi:hypothetical protein
MCDTPVAFSESSQTFLTLGTPDLDWECPGHLNNVKLRFVVFEDPEPPVKRAKVMGPEFQVLDSPVQVDED